MAVEAAGGGAAAIGVRVALAAIYVLLLASFIGTIAGVYELIVLLGAPWIAFPVALMGALDAASAALCARALPLKAWGKGERAEEHEQPEDPEEPEEPERPEQPKGRARLACLCGVSLAALHWTLYIALVAFLAIAAALMDLIFCISADGEVEDAWRTLSAVLKLFYACQALKLLALGTFAAARCCCAARRAAPPADAALARNPMLDDAASVASAASAAPHSAGRPKLGRGALAAGQGALALSALLAAASLALLIWFSVAFAGAVAPRRDPQRGAASAACNPLAVEHCLFPFPSSAFEERDEASGGVRRVAIADEALPRKKGGGGLDVRETLGNYDGWSPLTPLLFELAGLFGGSGLAGAHALNATVAPNATTLILSAEDGSPVPHYAEIDAVSGSAAVAVLQPAAPLSPGTRYIAVVQRLADARGAPIARPRAFDEAWRRARAAGGADGLAQRYREDVLPVLSGAAAALVPSLEAVQLCWDFTVRSAGNLETLSLMREGAAEMLSGNFTWDARPRVTKDAARNCPVGEASPLGAPTAFWREAFLRLSVPSVLRGRSRSSQLSPGATDGATQVVDAGRLLHNFPSYVGVPCALWQRAAALPAGEPLVVDRIMVFGHGIFADRSSGGSWNVGELANAAGAVVLASDWRGFSRHDLPVVLRALVSEPELLTATVANIAQGFVGKAAALAWALGRSAGGRAGGLAAQLERMSGGMVTLGEDPEIVFYGFSAGGILGAGLAGGVIPFARAVLSGAGVPFTLILPRSNNWRIFDAMLRTVVYDGVAVRTVIAIAQLLFDDVTGVAVAARPALTPRVMLQAGLGDSNVNRLSTETLARVLACSSFPRAFDAHPDGIGALFGVSRIAGAAANATWPLGAGPACLMHEMVYEAQYAQMPRGNGFPPQTIVHFALAGDVAMQKQAASWLADGSAGDLCGDVCVREDARDAWRGQTFR